jgi:hypothetical protein
VLAQYGDMGNGYSNYVFGYEGLSMSWTLIRVVWRLVGDSVGEAAGFDVSGRF